MPGESIVAELPLIFYKNTDFDLGFAATSDEVTFYVTYSVYPDRKTAIWKVLDNNSSNKSVRAIKITNNNNKKQSVCIRLSF